MTYKINTETGLIPWFARNHVAANLLMVALIIGGILSAFAIKKEVFPSMMLDMVSIRVPYLGAAPQEVEEGVILKIEEAIENVEGIKKMTSTASEGMGNVLIEVQDGYDPLILLDEIKVLVDAIPSFPDNTEKPVIYQPKITRDVLRVALYGDVSERELKETAKDLRDDIAGLEGVTSVEVSGARDYEVSIEVSEPRLQEHNLTFNDIVNAVRRTSIDLPGGRVRSENGDILLRTKGQAYTGAEFAEILLVNRSDGTRLTLGDVATINDGFIDEPRFSLFDGKPTVNVVVKAIGDEDALYIADTVKAFVEGQRDLLPANMKMDVWRDSSFYLYDRLELMLNNMSFGAILVFLVLTLFLQLRLAFWVIVGIPVCFLGTLVFMPMEMVDVSVNMISLFGFILVLGIVVDDAIIMGESAYTEIDEHGHSTENVIRGVQRVAMPATIGVITTIIAFIPLLMVDGPSSTIWKSIGWVVIICLVFSLVESKLILPAHLAQMRQRKLKRKNAWKRFTDSISNHLKRFIKERYTPFVRKAIQYRYHTLSLFFSVMIIMFGLFGSGIARFVFFPNIPSDSIQSSLTMEAGASIEQRNAVMRQIEAALLKTDDQLREEYGESILQHYVIYGTSSAEAVLIAELSKGEKREVDGFEIGRAWRKNLPELPGVEKLDIGGGGGPGPQGKDISFTLNGRNLDELQAVANRLMDELRNYDGVVDVGDNFSSGGDELRFSMKPEAEALGLRLNDLAQQVRFGFYGAEAQRIQRDDEEIKVMVRYPKEARTSLAQFEEMRIRTNNNQAIPFSDVAFVEKSKAYSAIVRIDGVRAISVEAGADKTRINPQNIVRDLQDEFIPDLLQTYPSVNIELGGASEQERDSLGSLFQGFGFALIAMYVLMAVTLRSYSQPLMIMSVIPFGIIGAIIGHLLLGYPVSILSMCGIVALSGVVVNDSLILVDFVNRARAEGQSMLESAVGAGAARFRAIVLTSLTTFIGLIPIVSETSLQAKIVIPMAISLAFGILFATVITLILVPCLYLVVDDTKRGLRFIFVEPFELLSEAKEKRESVQ